jgi:lipoprotein-anchoring transpeptidase ErfK/SrfK
MRAVNLITIVATGLMTAALGEAAQAQRLTAPVVIPGIGPEGRLVATAPPPQGNLGGGFLQLLFAGRAAPGYVRYNEPRPRLQQAAFGREVDRGQMTEIGKLIDPRYRRQEVDYDGHEGPGTIVIDTPNKFLYLVLGGGKALRYGIGVGRPGFEWSGVKFISRKAEWPDWTPPSQMLLRRPDLPRHMQGGIGNPLGARALYLGSSLYRIHGTNEPETIGTNVSSGCIRMLNDDVVDLYSRVHVGSKVIVM